MLTQALIAQQEALSQEAASQPSAQENSQPIAGKALAALFSPAEQAGLVQGRKLRPDKDSLFIARCLGKPLSLRQAAELSGQSLKAVEAVVRWCQSSNSLAQARYSVSLALPKPKETKPDSQFCLQPKEGWLEAYKAEQGIA